MNRLSHFSNAYVVTFKSWYVLEVQQIGFKEINLMKLVKSSNLISQAQLSTSQFQAYIANETFHVDFEIKDKNNYFMSQIIVLLFRYKTRAVLGLKPLKV